MPYQEPLPSIGTLEDAKEVGDTVRISDAEGRSFDVRFLKDVGWSIEVRYDERYTYVQRQIFTGDQEHLAAAAPTLERDASGIRVQANDQTLEIDCETGRMRIKHTGKTVFQTTTHPFLHHEHPVLIEEGIMSLKVTAPSERTPFFPPGPSFATHMARFRYERPGGVILGLPGQAGEMNRNGYRFELYNTDETLHVPSRRPMYQSWPILFHRDMDGDGWICVFHDNPSRTFVDLGDFYNDVTFESQAGNTRVYILHGPTLEDVAHKCAVLLGGSQLPPLWAFGYQQCRWSYMSVKDLRTVAHSFRDHDIPLDALYYDIDYMDGFRVFTNNALSFGEMADFLQETRKEGIRSVCIVDPGVKIDDEYPVYTLIKESESYLTQEDGQPFAARVWAGPSIFPDFGNPAVQSLWSDVQKDWLSKFPFDGVWNDMNEPANFDGQNALTSKMRTKRGPITNEYNLYGYHMAKASRLGMDKWQPGKRTLIITRSGYAGVQKYAVIWHGDNQAWWEHVRLALETAIQYSLAGAYYTGADVPGFNGNPPDDLAVRFYQLGSVLPLFRGHSIFFSKDKEPYAFGKEANTIIKDTIRQRYSLLREWYSGFERSIRELKPPMLPVFDDTGTLVHDEFLLFGKFLVAPIVHRDQTKRLVFLPAGDWYRFGNATERIPGNQWLMESVTLANLPMFVRAGSIVVRNTVGRNADATFASPETFDIYPDAQGNAEGYWYGDDGESTIDPNAQRLRLVWDPKTRSVQKSQLTG